MIIRKCFDPVCVSFQSRSSDFESKYRKKDVDGNSVYFKYDEFKVSEYVGSFEKGCSLESLLTRCSLMSSRDIFTSMQQMKDGFEVDLSKAPKDLTEAILSMQTIQREHPELIQRMKAGENINDIIKSMLKTDNKEVSTNGKVEPGNE